MLLHQWESGNVNSICNSLFTIAIVSIVFRHRDFAFKIAWLGTKRKLNDKRMYKLFHPMHFRKIVDFDNILNFSLVSIQKLVPVCADKSYHNLNFLLQTSINVSGNRITIVLQW